MQQDIALAAGIILAVLSVVSVLTALIERRSPRVASVVVVIAGGLLLWAIGADADGFSWSDIPEAFINIVAAVVN